MRAGSYAVVDGVAYPLVRYEGYEDAPMRVEAPHDQPCPPGFSRAATGWERRVLPEEITEIFQVCTTARHRNRPVIVNGVSGSHAFIEYPGADARTAPELTHLRSGREGAFRDMVGIDELTDVIEQEVPLPVPPSGSSWLSDQVRAGLYALFEGVTYPASADRSGVRLWHPRAEAAPPFFEQRRNGEWEWRVGFDEVTALTYVETTARWKGNPITVERVRGDRAEICYVGNDIDAGPDLQYEPHGVWRGAVPVHDLTHVIQLPRDVHWSVRN